VQRFLDEHREFVAEPAGAGDDGGPYLRLLPHRDGTDGFFIARLRRR